MIVETTETKDNIGGTGTGTVLITYIREATSSVVLCSSQIIYYNILLRKCVLFFLTLIRLNTERRKVRAFFRASLHALTVIYPVRYQKTDLE